MDFVGKDDGIIAIAFAFIIASNGIEPADADLFAAEQRACSDLALKVTGSQAN